MKIQLTIALSLLILFANSQNKNSAKSLAKQLCSEWTYVSGSGGLTGMGPGWDITQMHKLSFKKNGSCTFFENKTILQKDRYKVIERKSQLTGEMNFMIDYKNLTDQSVVLKGDTLWLQDDMHDGFGYRYERKKL